MVSLPHHCIPSFRKFVDEILKLRRVSGCTDRLYCFVPVSILDIILQCVVKKHMILWDHTHDAPERRLSHIQDVSPSHKHGTNISLIETEEKPSNRVRVRVRVRVRIRVRVRVRIRVRIRVREEKPSNSGLSGPSLANDGGRSSGWYTEAYFFQC